MTGTKKKRYCTPDRRTFFVGICGRAFRNEFGELSGDGWLTLEPHFPFDGASPKLWNTCDIFQVGTPDGAIRFPTNLPKMFWAYATHDFLCRFRKEIGATRTECATAFRNVGLTTTFKALGIYSFAVSLYAAICDAVEGKNHDNTMRSRS